MQTDFGYFSLLRAGKQMGIHGTDAVRDKFRITAFYPHTAIIKRFNAIQSIARYCDGQSLA